MLDSKYGSGWQGMLEIGLAVRILGGVLPELAAFLALSAASKLWRAAARDEGLWRTWLFVSTELDHAVWDCDGFPEETAAVIAGKRPAIIIPSHRISTLPPFIETHVRAAADVKLLFGGNCDNQNPMASFARNGFHRLHFPKLSFASVLGGQGNGRMNEIPADQLFLTVASLSPFFRAKSLFFSAGMDYFSESLTTLLCCHLVQACHSLEHLHLACSGCV